MKKRLLSLLFVITLFSASAVSASALTNNILSHGYIPGWLYFDKDGIAVTGLQQVWGEYYYFRDAAGLPIRVQGEIVDYKGHKLYFDPNNGQMWRNRNANIDGKNYHIDENGYLTEI